MNVLLTLSVSIIIAILVIGSFRFMERKKRKFVKKVSSTLQKDYALIMFGFYLVVFIFIVVLINYLQHFAGLDKLSGLSNFISFFSIMITLMIFLVNGNTGVIQRAESQQSSEEIKQHITRKNAMNVRKVKRYINQKNTEKQNSIRKELNAFKDEVANTIKHSSLDPAKNSTPVIPVYAQRKVKKRNYLQPRDRKRHSEHSS